MLFFLNPSATSSMAFRVSISAIILVVSLDITFIFYSLSKLQTLLPQRKEYTYIGEDFPAQLPLQFPSAGLVMESGKGHFSLLADDEWRTVYGQRDGFIELGPANRTFLVSVVHQLHCLDAMRVGFVTNRTGSVQHMEHCLHYLRQMILCYSDTTLEVDVQGYYQGRLEHGADGIGSIHRCKDWTVVRDYIETHGSEPL